MSALLDRYLTLERVMLEFAERGDPGADLIRDLMDPLWYQLSDRDHARLDARGLVSLVSLCPVWLPAGAGLLYHRAPVSGAIQGKRYGDTPIGISLSWNGVTA